MTDKIYESWGNVGSAAKAMAMNAEIINQEPDRVVGVSRGGLPLAVAVSHYFDDIPLNVIHATHYDGNERRGEVKVVNPGLREVDEGDVVMLVDDVVDTGETILGILDLWQGYADDFDFDWVTASWYLKPRSEYTPDVWLEETDAWVVYPWEQ